MKEEKTTGKKRLFYYLALTVCVLLLVTATVLTVYFVTGSENEVVELPPQQQLPDDGGQDGDEEDDPAQSTGGEEAVRFVLPVSYSSATAFNDFVWDVYGYACHKAVDFTAQEGAAVCAIADGRVKSVVHNEVTGNVLVLDHGNGLESYYRYLDPTSSLKAGDAVKKGEKIGAVSAGYASRTPHLHLEVHLAGESVDPAGYLEIESGDK